MVSQFSTVLALATIGAAQAYSNTSVAISTTYPCNPAHSYPNGASCISTAGSLTLVTPAPASTTYACNPAHSYPNGAICTSKAGSLTLVTPVASASATSYACNPAHSYPNGASCISTAGSLSLVTPTSSSTAATTSSAGDCYAQYNACRGAPDANFSFCASKYSQCLGYNPFASNGTNTVTPAASAGDVWVTQVVTAFTTVCPSPTTFAYQNKTYTVTKPTTLTITDCPCKLTTPVKSLPPASVVTVVVSSYTTVCPSPTTVTIQSKTYTVSSSSTITISSCAGGCTITTPVSAVPVAPVTTAPASLSTVKAPSSTSSLARYTGGAEAIAGNGALMLGALGLLAL